MKRSIYLFLSLFLVVVLSHADWAVDTETFDSRVDFDSVVTFKDSVYHGGAVIDSGNHKILGNLTADGGGTFDGTGFAITDGKLTTADSVRFVSMVWVLWTGGANSNNATAGYHTSNSVDEDMYNYGWDTPYLIAGGTVVIDSLFLNYYTSGAEDSIRVILQTLTDGAKTKIDSTAWLYGATGWRQTPTIIPNGDVTITDDTILAAWIDCDNNGAADVRVDYFLRMVYHIE